MKKFNITYLFLIGFVFSLLGQSRKEQKINKIFDQYAYKDAAKAYEKLSDEGLLSRDLVLNLADSYYLNAEYDEAKEWFHKYKNLYGDGGLDMMFKYGQSLKSSGDYKDADKVLEKFYDNLGKSEKFETYKIYLSINDKNKDKHAISILKINSINADFTSTIHDSKLYFASSKKGNDLYKHNNQPFLDMYTVQIDQQGQIKGNVKELKGKVNSEYHESNAVITKDGQTMYFSRNNYIKGKLKKDKEKISHIQLYSAKLKKGKWKEVTLLPFNGEAFSTGHPALSQDEKTLYFVSDRSGGYGNTDLYKVAIKGGGNFGEVENLGASINTYGKEMFPFISDNGHLYFATNGHHGYGGLDVYVCENKEGTFKKPVNVGSPINSKADDFGYIVNETEKYGFVTSNRNSGIGDDDIYSFKVLGSLFSDCENQLKGYIKDDLTQMPLEGSKLIMKDKDNNIVLDTILETGEFALDIDCIASDLTLIAKKSMFTSDTLSFKSSMNMDEKVLVLKTTEDFTMNERGENIIKIDPIYFDLNQSYIRKDAAIILDKVVAIMKKYPEIKVMGTSHTDSRGSDVYNLNLSERRAASTVDYIIKKGIESSRIRSKGYGETLLTNTCSNGIRCSKEDHQANRRTEFVVLK